MKIRFVLIVLALLLLFACSNHNTAPVENGNLPIKINLAPAIMHGFNVSLVRVTITKGSFTQQLDLPIDGNSAEGTFSNLEIGTYAINVDVYDGFTLIATGLGTGTVQPSQNTTVHITLQFVPGGLEVVVNWGLPYEDCRRILLVGNSHTYYNGGVNTHLQSLINSVHPEWHAVVSATTSGGYTLENHFNDPTTIASITEGNWDLVILQEQSSRPMNEPDLFYHYASQLSSVIAQSGALTGFYMTWAWRNNPEMYVPIRDAYYYIGAYLDALVVPAGVAFDNANQSVTEPNLYDADNYHPSIYGTYLVACTMLAKIWDINPTGNTYWPAEIDAVTANFLQKIAWTTVQGEVTRKSVVKPLVFDEEWDVGNSLPWEQVSYLLAM